MPTWLTVAIIGFLATILVLVGGGFYFILSALQNLNIPTPTPGPSPPSDYSHLAAAAVASDGTGLADEYAAGALLSASEKIHSDPARKITTRKQFTEFLSDLGKVLAHNQPYNIDMGPIILSGFAWMDKPGAFTAEDRQRSSRELRDMALAFDAL